MAVKWRFIAINPCQNLILPKRTSKPNAELASIDDIKKLFLIYKADSNKMHQLAFYLAIGCGLRNSEIRALTIDDVDFKTNIIKIDKQCGRYRDGHGVVIYGDITPKTPSSVRKIYMPHFVNLAFRQYITTLPLIPLSKQVFYNIATAKPISLTCLSKRFTSIIKDNDLPNLRFHDLRHLQATLLIHSGVNVSSTSKRMGHSSSRTTLDVYTHSIDSEDRKAVKQLEDFIECINS